MENDKNSMVEQYLTKNKIHNNSLMAIVWLGFMGGLNEAQIDFYMLPEKYTPKQRDILRIALEEGLHQDAIKEALGDPALPIEIMEQRKKELLQELQHPANDTSIAIESLKLLAAQIENQMQENRIMGEFLRDTVENGNRNEIKLMQKQLEEANREKELLRNANINKNMTSLQETNGERASRMSHHKAKKIKNHSDSNQFKTILGRLLKKKSQKEKTILDILCDSDFTAEQMREVTAGYNAGLSLEEIGKYAKKEINAEKMKELRKLIETINNQKQDGEEKPLKRNQDKNVVDQNVGEAISNNEEPMDYYTEDDIFLSDDME
ncbi:hypothetical protein [uncultured Robinsoniella sp.]|uniref:hypothetical protein n=1 Tax=uncultured Robinsoniella sp. TaxID=904190 RepID=UPI00374E87C3